MEEARYSSFNGETETLISIVKKEQGEVEGSFTSFALQ